MIARIRWPHHGASFENTSVFVLLIASADVIGDDLVPGARIRYIFPVSPEEWDLGLERWISVTMSSIWLVDD